MASKLKPGDKVQWRYGKNRVTGTVKREITEPMEIKSHHVAARLENPEILVQSDRGGIAAHRPDSLEPLKQRKPRKSPRRSGRS